MKEEKFLSKLSQQARMAVRSLPEADQKKLQLAFCALDKDGDGSVSLKELERFCLSAKLPLTSFQKLYQAYDINHDGHLTFDEAIPFLFAWLVYCVPSCTICHELVLKEKYYSCEHCEAEKGEYIVCKDCFKHGKHTTHRHSSLTKLTTLVGKPHKSPLMTSRIQKTAFCSSCNLEHSLTSSGVLGGYFPHMIEHNGRWFCEFCAVWVCSICQSQHLLDAQSAREGQWSKAFICNQCNVALPPDPVLHILDVTSVAAKAQNSCSCKTCKFKATHGLTRVLSLPKDDTIRVDLVDVPVESMPSRFKSMTLPLSEADMRLLQRRRDQNQVRNDRGYATTPSADMVLAGGVGILVCEMVEGIAKAMLLFSLLH